MGLRGLNTILSKCVSPSPVFFILDVLKKCFVCTHLQIEEETSKFAKPIGIRTVSIIGGVSLFCNSQKNIY